jgi:hypothetical protein
VREGYRATVDVLRTESQRRFEGQVGLCVVESHDHDLANPHADDCQRQFGVGDTAGCQFCIDLNSADELLAEIEWEEEGNMKKLKTAVVTALLMITPAMAADSRPYKIIIIGPGGVGEFPEDSQASCRKWLDDLQGVNMIERPDLPDRNYMTERKHGYIYRLDDMSAHVYSFDGGDFRTPTALMTYRCLPVLR